MSEKPFVVDMRHDSGADSEYAVTNDWDFALRIAGEFWAGYDGVFEPEGKTAKKMFKVGEGYDTELDLHMRRNHSFRLVHAGGEGPFIVIQRAK